MQREQAFSHRIHEDDSSGDIQNKHSDRKLLQREFERVQVLLKLSDLVIQPDSDTQVWSKFLQQLQHVFVEFGIPFSARYYTAGKFTGPLDENGRAQPEEIML